MGSRSTLVLDDVLMAFDPERTRSALEELSELPAIQIIRSPTTGTSQISPASWMASRS